MDRPFILEAPAATPRHHLFFNHVTQAPKYNFNLFTLMDFEKETLTECKDLFPDQVKGNISRL